MVFRVSGFQGIKRLFIRKNYFDGFKEYKFNQDIFCFLPGDLCHTTEPRKGDRGIFLQELQQDLLLFGEFKKNALRFSLPLPNFQQYSVGQQVLVGNPDVDKPFPVFMCRIMRTGFAFWNDDLQNCLVIDGPFLRLERNRWFAIHGCRAFQHIIFLIGTNPCDRAIVLDPDQEPAAIGIRKSNQGAGNPP